ncbi:MAG: PEP-CTERM sorting domain-containing protein [Pedobacter sp.]
MFKFTTVPIILATIILLSSDLKAYPIVNGDFSNSLTGWTSLDVTVVNGAAELSDRNAYASLYQGISVASSSGYVLSFDFSTGIQPVTGGVFSDLLAGTLFFGTSNTFDYGLPALAIFDNSASSSTVYNGVIGSSPLGADWNRLHLTFTTGAADTWIFPLFDLFDLNQQSGEVAYIDNVNLTANAPAVPEPSTLLLVWIGTGIGLLYRRRQK